MSGGKSSSKGSSKGSGGSGGSTSHRRDDPPPRVGDPRAVGTNPSRGVTTAPPPRPTAQPGPQPAAGHDGRTPSVGDPTRIRPGGQGTGETRPAATGGAGDGADGAAADPRQSWFGGMLRDAAGNAASSAAGSLGSRAGEWAGEQVFGPSGGSEEPGGGEGGEGGEGSAEGGDFFGGLLRPGGAGVGDGFFGGLVPSGGGPAGSAEGNGMFTGIGAAVGEVAGRVGQEGLSREDVSTMPAMVPGRGPGGASTMPAYGSMPGAGAPGGRSDAYAWARARIQQSMEALPEARHASRGGLSGALDEAVEWALEESGLLGMLEKVTGNLAELNAATAAWQAQAAAVRSVAAEVRAGALPLAGEWAGSASDAFGGHMGEVAEALDQTAEEMAQTAQIINSAAQECAMAEGMVIEIITEAIEALIVSLAAEAVLAVVTFGAAALVGALIDEAEITVFVGRVAQVSTKLAKALEELLKALQEMGRAVKATRKLKDLGEVMSKMRKVETAFKDLRALEEGESKAARIAQKIDEKVTEKVGDWGEDQLKGALGIDEEDREGVQRGDGTLKGNLKAAGKSSLGVAQEAWKSDTNQDAVEQELLNDLGLRQQPDPYRVDRSRIQTAFG
ncbi:MULTISPECIES: WXG100 family type VII secretion target [Kitasatospora]|uniref:WXG100 family type VII secretion target n=1 Tax=Kitasatospora setae (strain ATCC 33774 / DSM 43861 / JCM 3304 / KCC A-0304 / NBRC 14216 / KM-6054) TaxID=452652 RepID=E4N9K0_KITSK|nr:MULTISPECIES: WXG100 family type VII secretion target [Kitasatospora]BAJ27881.1 hypothetical protein KSE_20580 [Kitasatospora setae KM-6054]